MKTHESKPIRFSPTNKLAADKSTLDKRMALYARVSTEEQTKGNYPSCDSQIEELEAECRRRGWAAVSIIRDEGYSAGTLKRPGMSEMRWLVETGQVDGVLCTWYDRLTRSRDFYLLDSEFKAHGVEFVTLHDPADTNTAAGRFMESMIVAAKTYERDQTSEKVRTKMRMRLEKGLHQGGLVPFGFTIDPETKLLRPNPEQVKMVGQIFRTYVETRSDFAVRDWLKAHQIPSPHGQPAWRVSTLRDLLCNRRYIAEIEINRKNKGVEGLPEAAIYRIVKAPHAPLVDRELFDLAQAIRNEKASASPHRRGRPHGYSQNKCNRVFVLQSRLFCGLCDHAMTPYYIEHKAGQDKRIRDAYVHYYICAHQQMQGRQESGHSNRVLARLPETWILEQIRHLVNEQGLIEQAFEMARIQCQDDLQPQEESLAEVKRALQENQAKQQQLVQTITSGGANQDLLVILNGRATELRLERARLQAEERRLQETMLPQEYFDAAPLRHALQDFSALAAQAEPAELQQLLRTLVRKIEWRPDGNHAVDFYYPSNYTSKMPKSRHSPQGPRLDQRLESNVRSGGPDRIRTGGLLRDRQAH